NRADSRRVNRVRSAGRILCARCRIDRTRRAAGNLRSPGSIGISSCWIIDLDGRAGEIAVAKSRRWHRNLLELALVVVDSQEVAEEERLVFPNGPADVGTVVVVDAR